MRYRILLSVVTVAGVLVLAGCQSPEEKEAPAQAVTLSEVPAKARATIETFTAGGEITRIEREGQGDKAVYDVEATVRGKKVEYDIASDGSVLSSEESIPYTSVPTSVQIAASRYFGSSQGLSASKEIEKAKTYYEVEGKKGDTTVTLKITDAGKIIEEEKG
jgi:uncharacterized membrane protein YkoI